MIDFKTMCETFRERAANWECNEGELGKIVASEIRGIVDVFEENFATKNGLEIVKAEETPSTDTDLLKRVKALRPVADKLSVDLEKAGQFVAAHAFDDVLHGLKKTIGVWNDTPEIKVRKSNPNEP